MEHRVNRFHDTILTRANVIFQRRTVGDRHVKGGNAPRRRLELIKAALDDARGDLRGDTATLMSFIDNDDPTGFFYGHHQGRHIEGYECPRVDDFHADTLACELRGNLQAALDHI